MLESVTHEENNEWGRILLILQVHRQMVHEMYHFTANNNYGAPLSSFLMAGFCPGPGFLKIKMGYCVLFFAAGCGHGAWVLANWMEAAMLSGSFWELLSGGSWCQFFASPSLRVFLHPAAVMRTCPEEWWQSSQQESLCPWGHYRVGALDQPQTKLLFCLRHC